MNIDLPVKCFQTRFRNQPLYGLFSIDIMRKQHEEDASDKWHVVAKELRTLLSGAMPRKVIKQTVKNMSLNKCSPIIVISR